jgi:hypothetical protein
MFIEKLRIILSNPEGIVCKKQYDLTYNPFGIERHLSITSYKHIFPSGILKYIILTEMCLKHPPQYKHLFKTRLPRFLSF